ncbi:MAG: type II secretion system protein F [Gammaproteobacteria bacterium HGW-Gammaproteobacteria-14]|nr:MAG: type II secretion system protein F [Gammaproteobacteria bacterium HGW-Gammaproteobacteria-14]
MAKAAKAAKGPAKAEKSYTFMYQGTDRKGTRIKGEITAKSAAIARLELRKQGLTPKSVNRKLEFNLGGEKKVTAQDISIFTRQMATMMKAGVPLVQSFDIVADGLDNPTMRKVVLGIKADVESGNNFAGALSKYPQYFDELFCSLVDSGEQSGALETMLERVAVYKEKAEALKAKIKKAMKYPATILVVAGVVTAILLIKVVPTFKDLFDGFGAELPAFTLMVIGMSEWLQANFLLMIVIIVGTIIGLSQAKQRSAAFRAAMDRLLLKLPLVGDITYKATVARYARTLSTTFAAGVPLIDALESCASAAGNVVYKNAILRIRDDVSTGQQLQFAMRNTGVFPSMALQMVAIGEESGALDSMLDKVATYFEDEVDNAVDGLTSMMEPMIMAFLGVVVGGLVVAMYLPIFQLGAVI